MIEVEVVNRSGQEVDAAGAVALARAVLTGEGVESGELGLAFVGADEIRALKHEHLGVDEETDALAFPIDGLEPLPEGVPRQLGDVVICPQVVGDRVARAARPRRAAPHRVRPRRGDGRAGGRVPVVNAPRKAPSILESFNYAFEGIIHVLRTQRNMRIHLVVAAAVLVLAFAVGVSKFELIALLLAIAFVLIAEMVNTALEHAIDVATTSFDPMAKLAKDIAAGAVLIATATAVAIGYVVFASRLADPSGRLLDRLRDAPVDLTLIALLLTIIVVIGTKALTGRGTPLRGGLPSGHAAVAFAAWMAVTFIVVDSRHRFLISSLALLMALLVAHSRVESGVHSVLEVAYGGVLGALVTLVLFQVLQ